MIELEYSREKDIIYLRRIGNIELHDILKIITKIDDSFHGLKYLYVLEDLRESITCFTVKDYGIIIDKLNSVIGKYNKVRCAILVDDPKNTALIILFEKISEKIENYEYKTFSTRESSITWLKKVN